MAVVKTTLQGIVMDVPEASGGTYAWFDEPPSEKHRQKIGTLLETPNFLSLSVRGKEPGDSSGHKGRGHEDIPVYWRP